MNSRDVKMSISGDNSTTSILTKMPYFPYLGCNKESKKFGVAQPHDFPFSTYLRIKKYCITYFVVKNFDCSRYSICFILSTTGVTG